MKYQDLIKTNMCILPWVSLETTPMGTMRPCCLAIDEITNQDGEKLTLHNSTMSDSFNSEYVKQLRNSFINNERPSTCDRCWREEDSGRRSKRINTLIKFKHEVEELQLSTVESDQLWFLDLKLGNICNLKCRICGSWSSSKWAAEEIQYEVAKGIDKKATFAYSMLKAGNWPRENTEFWEDMKTLLSTVKYFEFTGGEPMMIKEHFDLLKLAIDMGVAKDIDIHYNTNATQLPQEALNEIWPHFKHVEVAFSIDNLEKRFEYERHGASWSEANTIIDTFNRYKLKHRNLSTQLCFTINMFNCLYISDLLKWAKLKNFEHIHWNMLHDPAHFNVSYMPTEVKELFLDSLTRKQTFEYQYIKEVESLKKFISTNNEPHTANFILSMIKRTDQYRNESFEHLYPELYSALNRLES